MFLRDRLCGPVVGLTPFAAKRCFDQYMDVAFFPNVNGHVIFLAPRALGESTAFCGLLAPSRLCVGLADSSIMLTPASSKQAPTSQPPAALVECFRWPGSAAKVARDHATPTSILRNPTRTLKMSTHCSGIDAPVWAARVVEQFSKVKFQVMSVCERTDAAQKALKHVPGGHDHMFVDVLDMLTPAVRKDVDDVIKHPSKDLYQELSSIIMKNDLRLCAPCRASNHSLNIHGCKRQIVDLDITGSACTSYSPQGRWVLLIYFLSFIFLKGYRI